MERLGAIVGRLQVGATGSATPSAKCPVIGAPTTVDECNALREWAQTTPCEVPQPASSDQLAKHLSFMAAALPSKNVDDTTGKMRATVYASLLRGYPNEALAFMARRACQSLDWFPTPKQCLELLAEYKQPESAQTKALRLCQDFTSTQFDRWLANVRDGQEPGDVPESWMRIAVEQGVMRRLDDGSYVSRALYQGPRKAYVSDARAAA